MSNIEQIAKVCHNVNKAYCESIGDFSQPTWDDAPKWQKESAIHGVQCAIDNPDITPEQLHQIWMDLKAFDGWTYGEVKDVEKLTHPCMLPYDQLPEEQKTKDKLFRAVVLSFI